MDKSIISLSEYVDIVCELDKQMIRNGLDKYEIMLFRGQSNCNYELVPALARKRRSACDITIFNEERNLIELAKYKLPDIFNDTMNPVELLALLQHYGIPTRLGCLMRRYYHLMTERFIPAVMRILKAIR